MKKYREYEIVGENKSHGKSTIDIKCPYCNAVTTAYCWSLGGSGKRCKKCKAIHTKIHGSVLKIENKSEFNVERYKPSKYTLSGIKSPAHQLGCKGYLLAHTIDNYDFLNKTPLSIAKVYSKKFNSNVIYRTFQSKTNSSKIIEIWIKNQKIEETR